MPLIRSTRDTVRIGSRLTTKGIAVEAERLAANRNRARLTEPGYFDITTRVMSSPSLPGDRTSGREPTRKKGRYMPAIRTISSVVSLSSGKRGPKAKVWDRFAYVIEEGSALDITGDILAACKLANTDAVILAAKDSGASLTEDQRKRWKACLVEARTRAAEVNNQPTTDSGGYSTRGVIVALFTDDDGTEFVGLHIPTDTDTSTSTSTTDEDNDEDNDNDEDE